MTDSHPQTTLVVKGRKLDVSQEGDIVAGKGADILQAVARAGEAIEFGRLRSEETESIAIPDKDDVDELTRSPIYNIVDLLERLPVGCRLLLVSHSRGGLAGELLCRGQFNNSRQPFTEQDIELFDTKKVSGFSGLLAETKNDYQRHQEQLKKLNALLLKKNRSSSGLFALPVRRGERRWPAVNLMSTFPASSMSSALFRH